MVPVLVLGIVRLHEDIFDFGWHCRDVPMSRLLVVDDHLMLAEALATHLPTVGSLWIVGQCATSDRRLLAMVAQSRPDVIMLDVEPVGPAAGPLVRRVQQTLPSSRVVVLTGCDDLKVAIDVARAGAAAWVPKRCRAGELANVLHGVCAGHAWFPSDVLGPVLRQLRADVRRAGERHGPLDVLSDRERDVLLGMVAGKRGGQIAGELMISAETVRTHTRSILSKLHVHSQIEAVSIACAAGMGATEHTFGDSTSASAVGRW